MTDPAVGRASEGFEGAVGDPEPGTPASGEPEVPATPGPAPRARRRHRRVVALSDADRARAAAGEDVFAPSAGSGILPSAGAGESPRAWGDPGGEDAVGARDADILREVPPHWHGGRGS